MHPEIKRLKEVQIHIENWTNLNNKPQKYLWEHELGWLDYEQEKYFVYKEIMKPEQYIELVCSTESNDWDKIQYRLQSKLRILHALIGINTENGELQDQFKKHIFYGRELDRVNLIEEMGDLFWYLALLADELNVSFEEIWYKNIEKLKKRYEGKFTETKAENRDLEAERKILEK